MKVFNFFCPAQDLDVYNSLLTFAFCHDYASAKVYMNRMGYIWNRELHNALETLLNEQAKLDLADD